MQSGREEERYAIRFCFNLGKNATETYGMVQTAFGASCINRSSKVSDYIFEIHLLWQSGFSRVHTNSCCSCSFEPEIIIIGQSSHTMYSNNIVNFQESTTILNAHTKKVWKLIVCSSNVYIYIYTYMEIFFLSRPLILLH